MVDDGAALAFHDGTPGSDFVTVTADGGLAVLANLHRAVHPNNALAVVRNIALDRNGDQPVATGGELKLVIPWEIDEGGLLPIAYDYRTGI